MNLTPSLLYTICGLVRLPGYVIEIFRLKLELSVTSGSPSQQERGWQLLEAESEMFAVTKESPPAHRSSLMVWGTLVATIPAAR